MRVLIVDDENEQRSVLKSLVSSWGSQVLTATDGEEALQLVHSERPHVMLTDLQMPKMDGFELMSRVRSEYGHLPTIVMTGFGNVDIAIETVHKYGAFWFLESPSMRNLYACCSIAPANRPPSPPITSGSAWEPPTAASRRTGGPIRAHAGVVRAHPPRGPRQRLRHDYRRKRFRQVSINGADPQGDWDRLIQPLDRGSVDVAGLVRTLVENGYRGPIGLQCYAIKGDPRTNLQRSMAVWRRISAQAASGSAPPAIGAPTPNEPRSQANDAAGVLTGEPIFKKNCSFCHGAEGLGASGPSLAGSSLVKNDTNGDLIGSVVHNGRAAKGMPGFSFSDTDTMALVQYLHLLSERATNSDGKLVSDEKLLTVGNLHAGQSYFAGPGRCGSCHSPLGDLKGIGSKYTPGSWRSASSIRVAGRACELPSRRAMCFPESLST